MSNPIARNLLALSLIVAATACAPRTATVADPASVTAPAAASLITQESVRAHMEFLASDALNGRGSGTRDEWIAVTYIASQLRRWGLEPMGDDGGYVQAIRIERPTLAAPPVLTLGDRRFTYGQEITVASMNAAKMEGPIASVEAGQSAPKGSVVVVPEFTRELTQALAPASLVLAKSNGCGGFRAQPGALPRVAPRTVDAPAAPAQK